MTDTQREASIAIEKLADVGPKTAAFFHALGIVTAQDLLDYFPFRYEDLRFPTPSNELHDKEGEQNAVGRIVWLRERRVRGGLEIVEARLEDDAGMFLAKWIGKKRFVIGRFHEDMRLFVRGRIDAGKNAPPMLARSRVEPVINVSTHKVLGEAETYHGEVVPIYHASADLSSRKIAQVIKRNFPRLVDSIGPDPLPRELIRRHRYPYIREAYRAVHFPTTPQEAYKARERFIFAEFLALATAAQQKRMQREHEHGAQALRIPDGLMRTFTAELPFALTGAQERVIHEIWNDMALDIPMNRLLQGDVGSGKTLVAAAAVVLAARNGVQSALMAPTEILASQHAEKLAPLLMPFGIAVEVVLGSQGQKSRNAALDRLASGEAALAIGTHALLTEGVEFARLGLVIIDEQHRFGVHQRARLRAKGGSPHTLHMTATPIPRTLAQSIFADLDASTIDELPPGRTPIETFAIRRSRMIEIEEFIRINSTLGHQAYIVAPAIDEAERDSAQAPTSSLTSVLAEAERLKKEAFPNLRVDVLHGKLQPREKDEIMKRFARGEIDVLVATTVVEVGVDVPNASVMVVLDAHRYGLAQLHQLRGRVGRGAAKSFCLLVAPDENEEVERLTILTETTDGFKIAEEDLRLRGPGQFSGTLQAGKTNLRFGDLVRDIAIYRKARVDAEAIVAADPLLEKPEHAQLRQLLESQPSAKALVASS